jgi:hypothetical protein
LKELLESIPEVNTPARSVQKFKVVRTPKTDALPTAPVPLAFGTFPPGWTMYWKSGCKDQPV